MGANQGVHSLLETELRKEDLMAYRRRRRSSRRRMSRRRRRMPGRLRIGYRM